MIVRIATNAILTPMPSETCWNNLRGGMPRVFTFCEESMIELSFAKGRDGLLPAIVQDCASNEVLMLAYINEEAWRRTISTGKAHFWSRSRGKLWLKGETSGHVQLVREILVDCDEDTVVFKVEQVGGAACHKGYRSCFFRRVSGQRLEIVGEKMFDPAKVYK